MSKRHRSLIVSAATAVAREVGADIYLEPDWGMTGCLTKGRRKVFFVGSAIDINRSGASALAKDKDYTARFLSQCGYSVVPNSRTFYSKEWGKELGVNDRGLVAAVTYAEKIGFPVVVKPNSGMQGTGVAMVWTKGEVRQALREIFQYDRVALVQSAVAGRDYRLVVLDGMVVAAYERRPLSVIGDGKTTIAGLFERLLQQQARKGRKVAIDIADVRIHRKLKHGGHSIATVPARGEEVVLLDAANLSLGGEAVDVTAVLHPRFKRLAVTMARDAGLLWCGIDLMVVGDIKDPPAQYWVLEINAAPGISHFAAIGPQTRARVLAVYMAVFHRALQWRR